MLAKQDNTPPPGPTLSDQIRAIRPGKSLHLADAKPVSVRAIVCRVKSEFKGSKWITKGNGVAGTRVWRLK